MAKPLLISGEITSHTYDQVFNSLAAGNRNFTINSPGGSVYAGLGIYDMFKNAGDVKVELNGMVASIASIMILGAQEVTATENSRIMVHLPTLEVSGNVEHLENAKAELEEIEAVMLKLYEPFGFGREALKKETYLSAEQAKNAGLIHNIKSLKLEPMANHKTIIEQLKAGLGLSPKAVMVSVNGAEVEVSGESVAVGASVALENGTHSVDDSDVTFTVVDGVITEVGSAQAKAEADAEELSAIDELKAQVATLTANYEGLEATNSKLQANYDELKGVAEKTIEGFKPAAKVKNFTPKGIVTRENRFSSAAKQTFEAKRKEKTA